MNHHPTHPPNPADARALTARLADWRAFAAAAGASLAAVSNADASIIYASPGVDLQFTTAAAKSNIPPVKATFTVGGSRATVSIARHSESNPTNKANFAYLRGAGALFATRTNSSFPPNALNFARGASIGGQYKTGFGFLRVKASNGLASGYFATGKSGIAGFQLANGDKGWVEIEVIDRNNDGFPDEIKILGDAYNTVPGAPILAGGGEPAAAPEPSTTVLALLAAGSAGVLAWRKRRTQAQA